MTVHLEHCLNRNSLTSLATQVFAGKPMVYLNVMWKYLGQQSFHLTEREYLEVSDRSAAACFCVTAPSQIRLHWFG